MAASADAKTLLLLYSLWDQMAALGYPSAWIFTGAHMLRQQQAEWLQ